MLFSPLLLYSFDSTFSLFATESCGGERSSPFRRRSNPITRPCPPSTLLFLPIYPPSPTTTPCWQHTMSDTPSSTTAAADHHQGSRPQGERANKQALLKALASELRKEKIRSEKLAIEVDKVEEKVRFLSSLSLPFCTAMRCDGGARARIARTLLTSL